MDFFFVTYLVVGLLPSRFSFWFIYLNLLFFWNLMGVDWIFRTGFSGYLPVYFTLNIKVVLSFV